LQGLWTVVSKLCKTILIGQWTLLHFWRELNLTTVLASVRYRITLYSSNVLRLVHDHLNGGGLFPARRVIVGATRAMSCQMPASSA
jgi:hypothetical protein